MALLKGTLVAGGAIGNLIDRLRFGRVVDFIDIGIPDINILGFHLERWWTLNIADAAISGSVTFPVIFMLFFHKKPPPDAMGSAGDSPHP